MILLIDNFDSFTYNLFQHISELGSRVKVVRNNEIDVASLKNLRPKGIVLSPGPGRPENAGIGLELVQKTRIPVFGVCLGHQTIAQACGARIVRAKKMMHGKISEISHDGKGVYRDINSPITVTRYHSLIVDETSLPACFSITSRTSDGLIMGIRHKKRFLEGVQFHPESFKTEFGMKMLDNFLSEANS